MVEEEEAYIVERILLELGCLDWVVVIFPYLVMEKCRSWSWTSDVDPVVVVEEDCVATFLMITDCIMRNCAGGRQLDWSITPLTFHS